jgi:DNA (cytosine-5)-methyltransferase 1
MSESVALDGYVEVVKTRVALNVDAESVSQPSMFSAEDFPASRTHSPADVADPPMIVTSGPSTPVSFASCDPDGSWRKTCQGYSQVTLDGSLERFSETWPRAGMTRNGIAYLRPPSALLTDGTASGLWPTPISYNERGSREAWCLAGKGGMDLVTAVKMWPTPTSRDHKDGSAQACANVPTNGLLGRVVHESSRQQSDSGASGSLNPVFVEWLMGYPLGWTVCAALGTRLSRKSRNGSAAASSTPTTRKDR